MTRIYMIAAVIVILLVAFWALDRAAYRRGVADTEAKQIADTQEILTRAEAMAVKSRRDITELRAKYARTLEKERSTIHELIQINSELAAWWAATVHPAAVDFVFSVPTESDTDSSTVPGADRDSTIGYTKQANRVLH